jgi:hypothetical protein
VPGRGRIASMAANHTRKDIQSYHRAVAEIVSVIPHLCAHPLGFD